MDQAEQPPSHQQPVDEEAGISSQLSQQIPDSAYGPHPDPALVRYLARGILSAKLSSRGTFRQRGAMTSLGANVLARQLSPAREPLVRDLEKEEADKEEDEALEELLEYQCYSQRAPWLRALILGANDGLVSVSSLMMGVGAGSRDRKALALSGVAGWVGGALSMACGEWVSVASQRDAEQADIEKKRKEHEQGPGAKKCMTARLARVYEDRGLPPQLAQQVALALADGDLIRHLARDELGIDMDDLSSPFQACIVSMLSFTLGALMPLLAAIFIEDWQLRISSVVAVVTLGLVLFGCLGAWLGGASILRGGARVLLGGWLAMAVTYGVGSLFGPIAL